MVDDRVQISVWVDNNTRDEWDDYADELGFESRGALIRNAVRYYYLVQTKGDSKRIINKLNDMDEKLDSIESKSDSIKIDQFESKEIDDMAQEVRYQVVNDIVRVLGQAESISDIEPFNADERGSIGGSDE